MLALFAVGLMAEAAPGGPPLTAQDLFSQAEQVVMHVPKDEFDAPPKTTHLQGRRFRVTIPAQPAGEDMEGIPTWTYDTGLRALAVRAWPQSYSDYVWKVSGYPTAHLVVSVTQPAGSRLATSGSGVKVRIKSTHWMGFGIGAWRTGGRPPSLDVKLPLEPDAARELSKYLGVVIEGEILPIDQTSSVACGTKYYEATLDDREEQDNLLCVYNTKIDRLVLVDRRTGKELTAQQPESPRTLVVTNPDWSRRPSDEDIARYMPTRAENLNVSGRATIRCTVTESGTLTSCSLQSEDPEAYGFGDAALRLSRLFRMKPVGEDGRRTAGATVTVPIRFPPS